MESGQVSGLPGVDSPAREQVRRLAARSSADSGQRLCEGAADVPGSMAKSVEGLETRLRALGQDDPGSGYPVGFLSIDQVADMTSKGLNGVGPRTSRPGSSTSSTAGPRRGIATRVLGVRARIEEVACSRLKFNIGRQSAVGRVTPK